MEIIELPINDRTAGMSFNQDGEEKYFFTTDVEKYDEMIEWLFEYTAHRFTFLGTNRIYFEDKKDAAIFKIAWL